MQKLAQNQSSRKFFGTNADFRINVGNTAERISNFGRDSGLKQGRVGNKLLHSDVSATFIGFGLQVDESKKNISPTEMDVKPSLPLVGTHSRFNNIDSQIKIKTINEKEKEEMAMTASSKSAVEANPVDGKEQKTSNPQRKKTQSKLSSTQKMNKRVKTLPKPRKELNMNKIVASESRALFMDATEQEFYQHSNRQLQAQKTHQEQVQRATDAQLPAQRSKHRVFNTLN